MRISLSTYARILLAMMPREAAPELSPIPADRRLRLLFPLPGAERLGPDVCARRIGLLSPQMDGFLEESQLCHLQPARHPLHLVESRLVQARREDSFQSDLLTYV